MNHQILRTFDGNTALEVKRKGRPVSLSLKSSFDSDWNSRSHPNIAKNSEFFLNEMTGLMPAQYK